MSVSIFSIGKRLSSYFKYNTTLEQVPIIEVSNLYRWMTRPVSIFCREYKKISTNGMNNKLSCKINPVERMFLDELNKRIRKEK